MEHANVHEAQSNRAEFDIEERIVDVLGRFRGEKTNAAGSSHGKSCCGDGHRWCGNGGEGSRWPKTQQAKINNQNGTEEGSDAQNVDEINDAIRPHTRLAHGVAKHGTLEPRHEFVQTELPCEALLSVGIDVKGAAVPDHPLRLDLITLWVAIAVTLDRHHRAHRNDAFLQTGVGRACWRR